MIQRCIEYLYHVDAVLHVLRRTMGDLS